MTTIDLNQSPYFDDFLEGKKFYQILFRPGRAVQARELNQIQSQIKSQIDRFGKHIFENGAQVLPGSSDAVKVTNNVGFIKLPVSVASFTDTEQNLQTYWLNKTIQSTSTPAGVKATIIGYEVADSLNEVRFYINYLSADTVDGTSLTFSANQTIATVETSPISATIPNATTAIGTVQSVSVEESVYFYNGRFILVDPQVIFLKPTQDQLTTAEAWNDAPTASVGLQFVESITSWTADDSLLDNATGTPNIGAPGADRLHITATLVQTDLNAETESFVEVVKVVNGVVQKRVIKTEYSVLEDTLATRTHDESGDYTVIPFQTQIKEFLRTATQDGAHSEAEFSYNTQAEAEAVSISVFGLTVGTAFLHTSGKWLPGSDYANFLSLADERLTVIVDPGKAYVKGYQIEKISTSLVDFKKARTTLARNNKFIDSPLGTYVYVENTSGALRPNDYDTLTLNDGTSDIGTARALALEYFRGFRDSSTANDNRVYRLFLFDIKLNDNESFERVRTITSINPTFSCDIVFDRYRLSGSVERGASGNPSTIIGTGTVWRNDELERLSAGDYIEVNPGDATAQRYTVNENPSTDLSLLVNESHASPGWPAGSSVDYLYASLKTTSLNAGLVYKLPDDYVSTVRGATSTGTVDPTAIDTVYSIRRTYAAQTASGNIITINAGSGEQFEDFSYNAYSIVNETTGDYLQVLPYTAGTPVAGTAYVRPLGSSLEVHLNSTDATGNTFQVDVAISKPGGAVSQERAKLLTKGSFDGAGTYQGDGFAVSNGGDVTEISLGKADVLRITRIVEGPAGYSVDPSDNETLPAGHTDITGLYILDNGQRDYYYGIAKVTLRAGAKRPRGKVRIEFDYFTHNSSTGDYFSVDSYPFSGSSPSMDYADIPSYTASDGTQYELADCLDFRPVVSAGGITAGFSAVMGVPKDNIRCDYHFYQGRRDKLFLDKTGEFIIKSGTPDVRPAYPEDPDSGMVIYDMDILPYTYTPKDVFPTLRDNKRYTMRDIGKLEKRISNIEYYTSLSLLEKDTNALKITDALGNDRFKNGFLVDNFKTFGASDLGSSDFRCSLDRNSGIVRPLIQEDAVSMFEKALLQPDIPAFRNSKNYQKTGELYTLKYTPVTMLEQTLVSKSVNVNPYKVFSYVGVVSITPWSDEWRETSYAEPLNVQDQGAWEASRQSFGPTGTKIDYTSTVNNWISTSTETVETGREYVSVAGKHGVLKQLDKKSRRRARKEGFARVPDGYANSGQIVPIGRKNWIAPELRTTTTLNGQEITTEFTSTFVDLGFSSPVSMGTRVIDTSLIEFIRSRDITFTGKAFKPGARLYPFFDGVDVSAHCTPDGGSLGDALVCDSRGRLQGTFTIPNTDTLRFKTGDRIFRLTTSDNNTTNPSPDSAGDAKYTARGWIDTKQEATYSTRLFKVNRDKVETSRDISLVTSVITEPGDPCPRDPIAQSFFVYEQGGCFITSIDIFFRKRPTGAEQAPLIFQVRELGDQGLPSDRILPFGEIVKEAVEIVTNEVDVATTTMTVTGNDNSDAKAPATNDTSGPWNEQGEYDANGVTESGVSFLYQNAPVEYMVPTRFTFESPIYLAENKSYCFVLMADSLDYEVWIAQAGPDTDQADPAQRGVNLELGTNIAIETDPYFQGVLFKSQNGITWTPDQTSDVKFKIWKADFDTSATGEIDFVNTELGLRLLTLDPLEFSNGSSYARVLHPNHAHTTARTSSATGSASKVVFSPEYDVTLTGEVTSLLTTVTTTTNFNQIVVGSFIIHPVTGEQKRVTAISTTTNTNDTLTIASAFLVSELSAVQNLSATSYAVPSGASLAGIDAEVLYDYRGYDVEYTELDYYRVDLGVNATDSGRFGGNQIFATENKRFEEITIVTTPLEMPETTVSYNMQTTSGAGVNDSVSSTYTVQPRTTFIPNEKVVFENPMLVGSYINELPAPGSGTAIGGPSNVITETEVGDRKSLSIRAVLTSSNRNISPVIDESRMTAFLASHRMDNPRGITVQNDDYVINAEFDNYTVIPTAITPAVSDTASKLYFSSSLSTATGTVTGTAGSRTLTGSGTKFLAELRVGDTVKTDQNEERVVETIASDTELLLNIALGAATTGGTLYISPRNMIIKSADASIANHLSTLDVGKYLTVSNADAGRNFTDVRITSVQYTPNNTVVDSDLSNPKLIQIEVEYKTLTAAGLDTNTNITFVQKDRFVDEISPGNGSAGSKYVSKKLTVSRPSNALRIMFDASRHESCELELYYKLELSDTTDDIDSVNWIKTEFNIDVNGEFVNITPEPNVSTVQYSEYQSTLTALPPFTSAQAKIVMRGGNPARSPRIKNFRMIILDE